MSGSWRATADLSHHVVSTVLVLGSIGCVFLAPIGAAAATAEDDYSRQAAVAPQPADIGGGYEVPPAQRVAPRAAWWYALDVALLAVALVLAALVAHRWRRRWMAVALSLAALGYFGFFRQGCVCPIGATQNVAAGLADANYAVPLAVLVFFLLPLGAALLAGRVFCGGPCPLGAIQDLVLIKPMRLPEAVDRWGGKFRYVYLAIAVVLAAAPAAAREFPICRFDPFVGFFRLSGPATMFAAGAALLAVGTVVGRPYCRFLCPYGAVLGVVSRFAVKPVRITPDEELDCGLCTEACPFGAIHNMRADRATCLACGRCFAHCPRQKFRWGEIEFFEIDRLVADGRTAPKPIAEAASTQEEPVV